MRFACLVSVIMISIVMGCSAGQGGSPAVPQATNEVVNSAGNSSSHITWGLWRFEADPIAGTLDVTMLRVGAMHLNALPFIDQPPLVFLTLESLEFNGNIIDTDIGLRHPFLGLVEFTGFDVKGILITNGSFNSFTDSDLIMATEGDTRLLNPDGLTRWWNPSEFPQDGTMFGYYDGCLGLPDSAAHYNSTLNGYRYFCDDFDQPDDPLSAINPEGRGVFSAGQKNVRHYTIELGAEGLVFNYAVDASWEFPQGPAPWAVPDDFGPNANQPEAYRIDVTELPGSTLFYDESAGEGGGDLLLSIDVYDWFGADLHTVKAEWPDFAAQVLSSGPTGGGIGYSTYGVDLIECSPSAVGEQPLLITVESESVGYGGKIPGAPVSAYFIYATDVPPGTGVQDPPDICNGWGEQTGRYQDCYDPGSPDYFFTQTNLASDSNGNVWFWCQRTSNALSRCITPFNGDWEQMKEVLIYPGHMYVWVFYGVTRDVSLTPTFDGELIAGCSPTSSSMGNPLSLAWWDKNKWYSEDSTQWVLYEVFTSNQIADRINGYRDSTGRFHAYIQVSGSLLDYYGSTWQGGWSNYTVAPMPSGQSDYACQTRTDFVAESSDGHIYLCWVDNGIKIVRSQAGTESWSTIFQNNDPDYDSPSIYIDNEDRVFLAARYYVSNGEDQIHLYTSVNGVDFSDAETIFEESGVRVDPSYLTLKGDPKDNLFLTFPYRPDSAGARIAIIAGNPGGTIWTDVCILTDPIVKHPALAVRPDDGSIEVCYAIPYNMDPDAGDVDNPFSEMNYIYGRSHPGFVN
jgi:hypothetical protein